MSCGNLLVAGLALASVAAMGCGGAPQDDATRLLTASSGRSSGQAGAVTVPAQRLYFGVTNHLRVAGDVLADLDLNAGARVGLEAATADSSPIRFELWQVHTDKHVELINAFDVESGFVLTSLIAPSDGVYLVHFPAPTAPRDVSIHLDCDRTSGRCTAELEPGERCFEQTACATGLACAPADAKCDPIWFGGTCVVPGDRTACDGLPSAQVCGCDGVTYGNECLAVASGSGMRESGGCPPS